MDSVNHPWPPGPYRPFVVVLGTNEIASAIATHLTVASFAVAMCHDAFPPVIRRGMAFHDALFGEIRDIEGVVAERADTMMEIARTHTDRHKVAVTELDLTDIIGPRAPPVIVDARMQKHRITPDLRRIARITVGVGPHFEVGINCDIAIETHPAETGAIKLRGATKQADGRARDLGGTGRERFAYADWAGIWHTTVDIGTRVYKGMQLGNLGGTPILAPIDGALRGIARDGSRVPVGVKLLEIDPRGHRACWTGMDERGRVVGSSAVAAIQQIMQTEQKMVCASNIA